MLLIVDQWYWPYHMLFGEVCVDSAERQPVMLHPCVSVMAVSICCGLWCLFIAVCERIIQWWVWSACLSAVYRACLLTDRELHSASIVSLFLGDLELYRLLNEIDKTVSMLQFVQTGSMNLETNSIEMDLALQPLRTENAHLRRYG